LILAKLLADNKEGNLTEEQVKFAHGTTARRGYVVPAPGRVHAAGGATAHAQGGARP
jgi:hypothetical protein